MDNRPKYHLQKIESLPLEIRIKEGELERHFNLEPTKEYSWESQGRKLENLIETVQKSSRTWS